MSITREYYERIQEIAEQLKNDFDNFPLNPMPSRDKLFSRFIQGIKTDPRINPAELAKVNAYIDFTYKKLSEHRGLSGESSVAGLRGNNVYVVIKSLKGKKDDILCFQDEIQAVNSFEAVLRDHSIPKTVGDFKKDNEILKGTKIYGTRLLTLTIC